MAAFPVDYVKNGLQSTSRIYSSARSEAMLQRESVLKLDSCTARQILCGSGTLIISDFHWSWGNDRLLYHLDVTGTTSGMFFDPNTVDAIHHF
jgi:hypothetical protein